MNVGNTQSQSLTASVQISRSTFAMKKTMVDADGTEAVRRKPYAVLLFDEIEKAHHDVFNVLLQLLDDGRLTDSQGRTVDFRNVVIIMTSNIGSPQLVEGLDVDNQLSQVAREEVLAELRRHFRPEFLNRLDDVVLFKPLVLEEIEEFVPLMIGKLRARLAVRRIELEISAVARQHIARQGFDPIYGARPLRRYLQRELETRIGRALIGGTIADGAEIRVDLEGDELVVEHDNPISVGVDGDVVSSEEVGA
jgi:ATP-dependent Clp protease ATP-binding subunit ClpB